MILTADEYHACIAVEAADAGKAVFIEKPMALTVEDADAIIEAEKRNNATILVGYMRRYAAAYERMKEEVASIKDIRYATVRDIIGPASQHSPLSDATHKADLSSRLTSQNSVFVAQSGTFSAAFSDFPDAANEDRLTRGRAIAQKALSPEQADSPRDVSTYRLLGSLGSHDLSAMRELLGVPRRCIAATRAQGDGAPFMTALFDYGGFTCTYETGIDEVADFDAHIEVIGDGKRVKISYDTVHLSFFLFLFAALLVARSEPRELPESHDTQRELTLSSCVHSLTSRACPSRSKSRRGIRRGLTSSARSDPRTPTPTPSSSRACTHP